MHEKVIEYYNQTEIDYRLLWRLRRNLAIHYGYYDANHRHHDSAVVNFNRVLASLASISESDVVLDAGCGIGGSSIWLAKNRGCKVVGISVVPQQIEKARVLAKRHGVEHLVSFELRDYQKTGFPDESFTVVWGLESICYAHDKKDFLAEAWRLLAHEGRVIVADGFAKKKPANEMESYIQGIWLAGWAVPNLASEESFSRDLRDLGFTDSAFTDVTEHVLPSSLRMYRASFIAYPFARAMQWLGIRTKTQTGNVVSGYYQYRALRRGLWVYGIFYAKKP
ncbi:MAG: methyltransferase domain-containing protein [bacterium]|nr:methyltransferase domain-containing protein [bacterium]